MELVYTDQGAGFVIRSPDARSPWEFNMRFSPPAANLFRADTPWRQVFVQETYFALSVIAGAVDATAASVVDNPASERPQQVAAILRCSEEHLLKMFGVALGITDTARRVPLAPSMEEGKRVAFHLDPTLFLSLEQSPEYPWAASFTLSPQGSEGYRRLSDLERTVLTEQISRPIALYLGALDLVMASQRTLIARLFFTPLLRYESGELVQHLREIA